MVKAKGSRAPAVSLPEETPIVDNLPGVARWPHRTADACGAEHFAVFLIGGEPLRLMPTLDSAYPGHAARTASLVETIGERFLRRAAESTRPFWWSADPAAPAAQSLSRCIWAEHVPSPSLAGASLALPLMGERDDSGLMVLSGERMTFAGSDLTDIHSRSLQL